jgi:hypothetical protein
MLRGKTRGLANRTECRFPRIAIAESATDKFAVNFGQIYSAAGSAAQQFWGQSVCAWFAIKHGEKG